MPQVRPVQLEIRVNLFYQTGVEAINEIIFGLATK